MTAAPTKTITVRAHRHEALDALAWRHLGATAGNVEAAMNTNPGLAKLAADLPEGHAVRLPQPVQPVQERINLWD